MSSLAAASSGAPRRRAQSPSTARDRGGSSEDRAHAGDPTGAGGTGDFRDSGDLVELAGRIAPVVLAGTKRLPVSEAFESVVPGGGLQRGTTVVVDGTSGATSLSIALAGAATDAGSWVAVVGMRSLGLAAVGELGVGFERLALVEDPSPVQWAPVVAALLDGFDLVLARPPQRVSPGDGRRLRARARERGAVLVQLPDPNRPVVPDARRPVVPRAFGGEAAELVIEVVGSEWFGLGEGFGSLRSRRLEVEVTARRSGAPKRHRLWLPNADGNIALADEAPVVDLHHRRSGLRTVS